MTKGDFFVICAGRRWCAIVRVLGNAAIPDEKFPWGTESEDGYPLSNLSPWVSEGGGRKMRRALIIPAFTSSSRRRTQSSGSAIVRRPIYQQLSFFFASVNPPPTHSLCTPLPLAFLPCPVWTSRPNSAFSLFSPKTLRSGNNSRQRRPGGGMVSSTLSSSLPPSPPDLMPRGTTIHTTFSPLSAILGPRVPGIGQNGRVKTRLL